MEFIKKHKFWFIGLAVFLVLMILVFLGIKELVYPDESKNLYGERLDGIEEVTVTEEQNTKIKDTLLSTTGVKNVTYHLSGRILNYIISLEDDVAIDVAKTLANKVIEQLSDEQKNYFDIQIFLNAEDKERYPLIGYKHKTSTNFLWSNRNIGEKDEG